MQIKLKVIPDSGPVESHEFKDYAELLEFVVNVSPTDEDEVHTIKVQCRCGETHEGTIEHDEDLG